MGLFGALDMVSLYTFELQNTEMDLNLIDLLIK